MGGFAAAPLPEAKPGPVADDGPAGTPSFPGAPSSDPMPAPFGGSGEAGGEPGLFGVVPPSPSPLFPPALPGGMEPEPEAMPKTGPKTGPKPPVADGGASGLGRGANLPLPGPLFGPKDGGMVQKISAPSPVGPPSGRRAEKRPDPFAFDERPVPSNDPFPGHTINAFGAADNQDWAKRLAASGDLGVALPLFARTIKDYKTQGKADVADVLGRLFTLAPSVAGRLRDGLAETTGESLPFRIAPGGAGFDGSPPPSATPAPDTRAGGANPFAEAGHSIGDEGIDAHERMADSWSNLRDFGPIPEDLAKVVADAGDQGRGDIADLFARIHQRNPDAAARLQDSLFQASGERVPFATGETEPGTISNASPAPAPKEGATPNPPSPLDPAVSRDLDALKDPAAIPAYARRLAGEAKQDPAKAESHARTVGRELYKRDPQAAERMVKESGDLGLTVNLYAEGHQAKKSVDDLLAEADNKHLSSGADAGSKQCVALVKHATPELQGIRASDWKEGERIKGAGDPPLKPGTALATFENGRYQNRKTGNHAVVFEKYDEKDGKKGMWVLEQSSEVAPRRRFIPFNDPGGKPIYQAEKYSVIKKP